MIDLTRDHLLNWILDLRDESRRRADRVRWHRLGDRLMIQWYEHEKKVRRKHGRNAAADRDRETPILAV